MVTDFHTHILPGIDDGSKNTAESINLLEEERQQGVDNVVLTPHFYAERSTVEHFLEKRERAYIHLMDRAREKGVLGQLPVLYRGAEICYFAGIGESEKIRRLTIEHTDVCLLELPFEPWDTNVLKDIRQLIEKQHLTIVLAHLERYLKFQKDPGILKEVLSLPLYVQCNAGPLLKFLSKGAVIRLFKEGTATILGSDCHNSETRPANLQAGREVLARKLGESILQTIDATTDKLLK